MTDIDNLKINKQMGRIIKKRREKVSVKERWREIERERERERERKESE